MSSNFGFYDKFTVYQDNSHPTMLTDQSCVAIRRTLVNKAKSSQINFGYWSITTNNEPLITTLTYELNNHNYLGLLIVLPLIGSLSEDESVTLTLIDDQGRSNALTLMQDKLHFQMGVENFPTIDLTSIKVLQFVVNTNTPFKIYKFGPIYSAFGCVSPQTQILMHNGTTKEIHRIERGDLVAGSYDLKIVHQVAEINRGYFDNQAKLEICEIKKNALSLNRPNQNLLIMSHHPVIHENARRPVKCLRYLPLIQNLNHLSIDQYLTPNNENKYILYDLQFDHEGSYIANGLLIQSRSPYSNITPLAKHLYFNQKNYREERYTDGYNQPLPLDYSLLL